ncbi:MAG TPA: ATP-binding cassette domain-containing protein [Sulfurospirillum arcachonense]|nr:ATP-binding cassette domain-containing protein [Sulfurospirillum arcachonense]HIP45257.1 ATP-binding cassette domain-containing protein [Sulfurospirillum arcachonense]
MDIFEVENLSYKLGNFKLDNVNFKVNQGEYFVLLGQSGSGKTLLLESIAGFNSVEGKINFEGRDISELSPEHRDVGFVYQDFALFSNLNVRENIMFSGKYKHVENPEETLHDLADFLGLVPLLERDIDNLSGGERQRVAIARALFSKPKILLLDEPLSAIDPTFRNSIMKFLKDIHRKYNLTTIHVTHNFREASYLADRIAIVMNGQIKQIGPAAEVLNNPANIEVAKFLGFKNILPSSMINDIEDRLFSVDPNAIHVGKYKIDCDYVFGGTLEECMGIVDHYKIFVNVDGQQFFAKILKRDYQGCYADRGESIYIGFDKKDVCYL